ncbi:hypothetical protein F4803DRAFT_575046 [Xylaria telfairii]|nr:hypothetical protein F4803DRAFT_575046 [Xylaria telfairii]
MSKLRLVDFPASPWAKRYGFTDKYNIPLVQEDPLVHSGLAPILPNLPPKYYDKIPREEEFEIANTHGEIDSILVSEECQRIQWQGIASWQLPPFNSILSWDGCPTVLGGHRLGDAYRYHDLLKQYDAQKIDVDEDSWFPFFRADRWYDVELEGSGTVIEEEDGSKWNITTWSVDDERVWRHLRFIIEIANRILLAMVRDNNEWLEMMLYGRIQLWYELFGDLQNVEAHKKKKEDKRILLPLSDDQRISEERGKTLPTVKAEPDPQKRTVYINHLLQNLTWTFIPHDFAFRGLTIAMTSQKAFYQVTCRINVNTLALLCGGMITVAERCILYTRIAITTDRPLLDEETSRHIAALAILVKYPSKLGVSGKTTRLDRQSPGFPSMKRDAPITQYLLPAALLWRLQSKAFWDRPVDGKKGFLFPKLFTMDLQLDGISNRYKWGDIAVDPDAAGDDKFSDLITRWDEQVQLWATQRPWYDDAYDAWKKTAWGFTPERILIERFIEGFLVKDEALCALAASKLQALIPDVNVKALPGDDDTIVPKYDTPEGGPQLWLLHCLGTLMLAALPMRKKDQNEVQMPVPHTLRRSKRMLDRFGDEIAVTELTISTPKIKKRNQFFSRISDKGIVRNFKRMQLVNHTFALMSYVATDRGSCVSWGWYNEICVVGNYIRKEITSNKNLGEDDWLPEFPFETPDYKPNVLKRWDAEAGAWQSLKPPKDPGSPSKVLRIEKLSLSG